MAELRTIEMTKNNNNNSLKFFRQTAKKVKDEEVRLEKIISK